MLSNLLISVISDDKPGVVEAIAHTLSSCEGSWLESRLSELGGKFAGVIRVSVGSDKIEALEKRLQELSAQQIWIKTERVNAGTSPKQQRTKAYVHLLGPDRAGIVKEISAALASKAINVSSLETSVSSMAYSGDPLFEARGQLEIPATVDRQHLDDALHAVADTLALDISLSETPFEAIR